MDNEDKVINSDLSEDDSSFNFINDGRSDDEREKFIEDLLKNKNDYLMSLGYVINDDGNLVYPNTRIVDGVIGFAVGDALGVPVEFVSRSKLDERPYDDMIGFGTHNVPEGTWSDDTSLVVATMESVIENGIIDYEDLMNKFSSWLKDGKYSAIDMVFDVGISTRNAILKFNSGSNALLCGGRSELDNGNGSLMRMLPIAYYLNNVNMDFEQEVQIINNVSSLTHGHEISCLGCKIYCDYVRELLNGVDKISALDNVITFNYNDFYSVETVNKYNRILNGDIKLLSRDNIKSSGYVVDTLEACLWSFMNSNNYEETVLKAINLGGDTDTIGAIAGSLAGIVYGKKDIPKKWLSKLRKRGYLEDISKNYDELLNSKYSKGKK